MSKCRGSHCILLCNHNGNCIYRSKHKFDTSYEENIHICIKKNIHIKQNWNKLANKMTLTTIIIQNLKQAFLPKSKKSAKAIATFLEHDQFYHNFTIICMRILSLLPVSGTNKYTNKSHYCHCFFIFQCFLKLRITVLLTFCIFIQFYLCRHCSSTFFNKHNPLLHISYSTC